MTVARRLAKLEGALPPAATSGRTYEEGRVLLYELALAIIRAGKSLQLHDRLRAHADEIARGIRHTVSRPHYRSLSKSHRLRGRDVGRLGSQSSVHPANHRDGLQRLVFAGSCQKAHRGAAAPIDRGSDW